MTPRQRGNKHLKSAKFKTDTVHMAYDNTRIVPCHHRWLTSLPCPIEIVIDNGGKRPHLSRPWQEKYWSSIDWSVFYGACVTGICYCQVGADIRHLWRKTALPDKVMVFPRQTAGKRTHTVINASYIYIHIHTYIYMYMYIHIYVCVYIY